MNSYIILIVITTLQCQVKEVKSIYETRGSNRGKYSEAEFAFFWITITY